MRDIWFAGKIVALLKEKIGKVIKLKKVTVKAALGPFTHVIEDNLSLNSCVKN